MAESCVLPIADSGKAKRRALKGEPSKFYHTVVLNYEADECLLWPFGRNAWGYGKLHIAGNRSYVVSRLVCQDIHGPAPSSKHEAAHSCGQSACCNKRHLAWKTPAENCADKLAHGTVNRGERNGAVRLTEGQAREVMRLKGKVSQRAIAKRFRVGHTTVRDIHDEKTWVWLF